MKDLVPGAVAGAIAAFFLFYMAYRIGSPALWAVIGIGVAAMIYDLATALRTGNGTS